MPRPKPEHEPAGLVPVKIRKGTYRILKTIAGWRGISILDYLDEIVNEKAGPDLKKVVEEIEALTKPDRPEKGEGKK